MGKLLKDLMQTLMTMAIMEAWSCYKLCLSMTRQDTFVIMGEPFIRS